MELLPEELLADVLGRLPERDLATARCVHTSWLATIDSCRLMQLLPTLPLAGIFINFNDHDFSELLARPTPPSATAVSGKFHQYMPTDLLSRLVVEDHCNGLLLLDCGYVVNPATRRWAALPSRRPSCPSGTEGFTRYNYIVFDPTVSPHYEVVTVPHLPNKGSKTRVEGCEWPPSHMMLLVFSSATNRWEERSFVRQGEALGTVTDVQAPWPGDQQYGVYWRGHLYVHHNFILRISLTRGKYKAIKPPHGTTYTRGVQEERLGRSEKGVYLASITSPEQQLQVWVLDESCAHTKWVFKHRADLTHILSHRSYNPESRGTWVMEDVNYHFYSDRFPEYSGPAPLQDRFEWDSDNDDVLDTKDTIEGRYRKEIRILGFHPHREVLFLSESMTRGLAYHMNKSKLQDLGNMYPTRYDWFVEPHALLLFSFPYTPCWTSEFPSNN